MNYFKYFFVFFKLLNKKQQRRKNLHLNCQINLIPKYRKEKDIVKINKDKIKCDLWWLQN